MKIQRALLWVSGHGLLPAALFGAAMVSGDPSTAGMAFFGLPLALGLFQSWMLRAHVRPWLWIPATALGFAGAFLFAWFFIPAIGFTVSLAQSFCLRQRPRLLHGAVWTLLGTAGWILGLTAGGALMPGGEEPGVLLLYTVTGAVQGALLLPAVIMMDRRQAADGRNAVGA